MTEPPDAAPGNDTIWVPPSARKPEPAPAEEVAESAAEPEPEPEPDWHDRYLRALADAENIRRRGAEQSRLAIERANQEFLRQLLPVVDGFDRALAAAEQGASFESLAEGLRLLGSQLDSFLAGAGVTRIDCAAGDAFDPEQHEAVVRLPARDDVPAGHIAGLLEPGYRLHGRVLRPARVAVAGEPLDQEA